MIKREHEIGKGECVNCKRKTTHTLKYTFLLPQYFILRLCEDCSNAIANLHYRVMEDGKTYKYDLDEISEVGNEIQI